MPTTTPPPGTSRIIENVRRLASSPKASERAVAGYIMNNLRDIPYETATSLAEKLELAPVTIGRVSRAMGFRNFREFKSALRQNGESLPWLAGEAFDRFLSTKQSAETLQGAFQAEMAAIAKVYELPLLPVWGQVVALLAGAPAVWIAGFQTERGTASALAYELQYLRPHVFLADGASGSYADVLLSGSVDDCVVIVDMNRYSVHARDLAERVKAEGKSLVILSDEECSWAHGLTPLVMGATMRTSSFWASMAPFASLSSLLLNDVARSLGTTVQGRLDKISTLYRSFVGFVDDKEGSHGGPPSAKTGRSKG